MTKRIDSKEPALKVGIVSKPHGIKGDLFIQPFNKLSSWPKNLDIILIGKDFTSFEVESYQSHKTGFLFKLKTINHIDQSEPLKGEFVYLYKNIFFSQKDESIYLSELLGFQIEVLNKNLVGVINSFKSTKFQDYLLVDTSHSKESLTIPFVQDYIQKIDFLQKKILLDLPEDFLEIFND